MVGDFVTSVGLFDAVNFRKNAAPKHSICQDFLPPWPNGYEFVTGFDVEAVPLPEIVKRISAFLLRKDFHLRLA